MNRLPVFRVPVPLPQPVHDFPPSARCPPISLNRADLPSTLVNWDADTVHTGFSEVPAFAGYAMHGSARRLAVVVLLLAAGSGCSRKHFRERTDKDVEGIITQKNVVPEWSVKNWFVYPHPCARFADPYNPDRPPYPADDPAARLLSPNPQHPTKKTGTGRYDGDGYLRLLEQWDAENRAGDGAARGAAPERVLQPLPPHTTTPNANPAARTTPKPSRPAEPAPDADQWVSAKPRVTISPEPADPAGPAGPRITESRGSVILVSGQEPEAGKTIPAVGIAPVLQPPTVLPELGMLPDSNSQPPEPKLPQPPEKQPDLPKPIDPKPIDPKVATPPGQFPSLDALAALGGTDADYLRALASNQQGYRIRLEQAVGLGLINSREFQDRREDLYLTALPVTLERYNFAAQAFFAEQVVRDFTGSGLSDAGRLWRLNTNAGFGKNFATGASLIVRLANQIVIDLGSDRPDIAFSTLSLSFVQPFLRGGGLAVTLEDLTQSERTLLYGMRSYARFRKLFYVAIAAGGNITNNPYGLQGLAPNLGRGIGGNLTSPVVGYLPLLQQAAAITNQGQNVAALERLLRLYQAFREGGQQSALQVDQVEVELLNNRAQLLGSSRAGGTGGSGIRGYLDALDNFKLQLGLPLTVGLDVDDSPLRPVRDQLARFEDLYADFAQLEAVAQQYNPKNPPEQFRAHWRRLLTGSDLVKGTAFAKGILPRWDALAKLSADQLKARVEALIRERDKLLAEKAERQLKNQPEPPAAVQRLAEVNAELELAAFEQAVREYEARPTPVAFEKVSTAFVSVALGAHGERVAKTRSGWPALPPLPVNGTDLLAVDLDDAYTAGIQAALSSRLDLMNARGQVVDAYRRIAIEANSLQGTFDVGYDISAATPTGDNRPFAFSAARSRQQLTFRGELPLVRRAERNNYRASLIGYQRQRRTLMAFEDNIANDVRADIRLLRTQAQLYRIQQRVVELAYSQVDNANRLLRQPLAFGAQQDAGSAAALTDQALRNQRNLLSAQNELYSLWVSYITARMNLYLDLELMQLDDRGVWIDEQAPGIDNAARPGPAPARERERLPVPKPAGGE
jgi:hypothetical protein